MMKKIRIGICIGVLLALLGNIATATTVKKYKTLSLNGIAQQQRNINRNRHMWSQNRLALEQKKLESMKINDGDLFIVSGYAFLGYVNNKDNSSITLFAERAPASQMHRNLSHAGNRLRGQAQYYDLAGAMQNVYGTAMENMRIMNNNMNVQAYIVGLNKLDWVINYKGKSYTALSTKENIIKRLNNVSPGQYITLLCYYSSKDQKTPYIVLRVM